MAIYYVRKTGSDGAAGTSAGAAWATIGKALGATGISSGDTVYIGAGIYRETVVAAMTSATVETFILGDVDGSKTGDYGEVVWTAFTTDDKTAASGSTTLAMDGRDFLTFRDLTIVGGTGATDFISTLDLFNNVSHDITFTRCTFTHLAGTMEMIMINTAYNVASNILFDQCRFLTSGHLLTLDPQTGAGSDYDMNIMFRNCFILSLKGDALIWVDDQGVGAGEPGGLRLENCTVINGGGGIVLNVAGTRNSLTIPTSVTNCLILCGGTALFSDETGALVESNNLIYAPTPRASVDVGTGSVSDRSYALMLELGQSIARGAISRPFFSPVVGSPVLGFGGASPPAVDATNGPRPAGGLSALTAVGAYERGQTFTKETTTVRTGANAVSITGPGYQDFNLPVAASSTTITIYVRWDATYAGTKPIMQVLNGTECGVADDTATAIGSSGAWEQLSLNFTPTSTGIVTVRLLSSDTNGGGVMFADDFAVA